MISLLYFILHVSTSPLWEVAAVLADRYHIRLEAARRHSGIRLVDKKPDQL